jgi:hypothetical protein
MSVLTVEPLSRVRPDSVHWLWRRYLPRGKLSLLDGDPGVGKSLLTIDLAARLSRGGPLPDGQPAERPHTILLLNAEDAAADTTRPRATAAGADLDRLHVISSDHPPHLPGCLPDLEQLIRDTRADLLVIDPLMAFLPPKVAANIDQCVRTALTPLAALAERTDCGVLLVRHLRKLAGGKAVHRGQGSMGILGAARTALLAGQHPSDRSLGMLTVTKTNVIDPPPTRVYRIAGGPNGFPVVEWVGVADLSADAIGVRPPEGIKSRERAGAWLHEQLRAGPRPAIDLLTTAADAGIPEATLRRAKREMRVNSHRAKIGPDRYEWYWYDPDAPWPADTPFKKPFQLPPLELDDFDS